MKIIYSNGSSTVYGKDLVKPKDDLQYFSNKEYRENKCFPALIRDYLSADILINDAQPASSNSRICRTSLYSISKLLKDYSAKDVLCVISFSPGTPIDLFSNKLQKYCGTFIIENYLRNVFDKDISFKKTPHKDENIIALQDIYEQHFLNFTFIVDNFVKDVLLLQNFLKLNKVKYLMMHTAPLIPSKINENGTIDLTFPGDNNKKILDYLKDMQIISQIDLSNWVGFLETSIIDYTKSLNKGKTEHILEDGHKLWFNHIKNRIDNICIHQ